MKIVGIVLLIILIILVFAFLFCLFCKICLEINFSRPQNGKFSSSVQIDISNGIIKKTIPLKFKKKKKEETDSGIKAADELSLVERLKKYYQDFLFFKDIWSKSKRSIRKRILADEITLNVAFGTGDAAHTGIATGAVWGAVYNVIGFMANFIRVTEPQITVTPDYENEFLDFDGKCILRLSVANIISVFFIIYINYYLAKRKKIKKEKAAIKNVNTN